jgi:coenzyme F420-0:L-glutamate ligase/coenzyme F420-1:gamma-L-glutamate ligase
MARAKLDLRALTRFPLIAAGDDLAAIIWRRLKAQKLGLKAGDVLVVAQKVVSKAEGRFVALGTVTPSPRANLLAAQTDKDPRVVELILAEARAVIRQRPGLLVVEHRLGFVLANAGIDSSNVGVEDTVLLLPEDPDASAARLRARLAALSGIAPAVVINDSLGRAFRNGIVGTALGAVGLPALADLRGTPDLFGRPLQSTEVGLADEIASAGSLLQGEAGEGQPVVLVRGLDLAGRPSAGAALVRAGDRDLFR